MVEEVQGGCIPAKKEFLKDLREVTRVGSASPFFSISWSIKRFHKGSERKGEVLSSIPFITFNRMFWKKISLPL